MAAKIAASRQVEGSGTSVFDVTVELASDSLVAVTFGPRNSAIRLNVNVPFAGKFAEDNPEAVKFAK